MHIQTNPEQVMDQEKLEIKLHLFFIKSERFIWAHAAFDFTVELSGIWFMTLTSTKKYLPLVAWKF